MAALNITGLSVQIISNLVSKTTKRSTNCSEASGICLGSQLVANHHMQQCWKGEEIFLRCECTLIKYKSRVLLYYSQLSEEKSTVQISHTLPINTRYLFTFVSWMHWPCHNIKTSLIIIGFHYIHFDVFPKGNMCDNLKVRAVASQWKQNKIHVSNAMKEIKSNLSKNNMMNTMNYETSVCGIRWYLIKSFFVYLTDLYCV